jgi:hypothetical protein
MIEHFYVYVDSLYDIIQEEIRKLIMASERNSGKKSKKKCLCIRDTL